MAETLLPDGTSAFDGGQNSALEPGAIAANQYFSGINISCQKTSLTPRWGITQLELDFSETGDYTRVSKQVVSFEEVFYSGKFQAFIPYSIGPDKFFIYVVSGFIYIIDLLSYKVSVLNKTDQLNVYADRINWSNAGEYLVLFDFPNNPFILQGIQIHRADPALYEVPISVMGTYNQNRLCIGNAGIDWTAGDPAGSTATPNAPITFEEIMVASSPYVGDVYQVPTANKNNDFITAMGFLQVLDTSTGIGPLLVATQNAIYSYRTDLPRISWQGGVGGFVFGSVLLYSDGIVGQRAHTNLGSDLIFLSSDGQIRALSMARNEQKLWSNSPISREVNKFLQYTDPTIAYVGVIAHAENKVFTTCNPYRVDCYSSEGVLQTDYVNGGVVVLELDNTAGLNKQAIPVWAGLWTGVPFMDFGEIGNVFYFAGKQDGRNAFFMFDPSRTYDTIHGKTRHIRSVIETKEYDNEIRDSNGIRGGPTVNKALHSLDLGLRELEETVNVNVTYKPSTVTTYNYWKDMTFHAPVEQCQAFPIFPNGLSRQGIRDLSTGGVDESVCDPTQDTYMHEYKGVQIRLIIEGKHWELQYIKLKGIVLPQTETDPYCEEKLGVPIPAQCFDPWFIPDIGDC